MKNKLFWNEAPLLRLTVCLMAGIVIGDYVLVGWTLLLIFIAIVLAALLLGKHEYLQSMAIAVCFLLMGWLLMQRQ